MVIVSQLIYWSPSSRNIIIDTTKICTLYERKCKKKLFFQFSKQQPVWSLIFNCNSSCISLYNEKTYPEQQSLIIIDRSYEYSNSVSTVNGCHVKVRKYKIHRGNWWEEIKKTVSLQENTTNLYKRQIPCMLKNRIDKVFLIIPLWW